MLSRSLQSGAEPVDITIALLDSQQFVMQNEFVLNLVEKYASRPLEQDVGTNITV